MPLDHSSRPSPEEIEQELDELFSPDEPKKKGRKKEKKKTLVCPPMRKKKDLVLGDDFLDPAEHTFSKDPQLGDVHEYLMSIWPEEGLKRGDVLEVGFRISKRPDCSFKMLPVCNALADLAQLGKVQVKEVITSSDKKHVYGIWKGDDDAGHQGEG